MNLPALPQYLTYHPTKRKPTSIVARVPTLNRHKRLSHRVKIKDGDIDGAIAVCVKWRDVIGRSIWRENWGVSRRLSPPAKVKDGNNENDQTVIIRNVNTGIKGLYKSVKSYLRKDGTVAIYQSYRAYYRENNRSRTKSFTYQNLQQQPQAFDDAVRFLHSKRRPRNAVNRMT